METLFLSRYLLPVVSSPLEDGGLLVRDGRIVALGKRKSMTAAYPQAAVIDFGDAILLPPMVNAHTHLELTHFPRWAAEMGEDQTPSSFVDWILQVIRVKRGGKHDRYRPSVAEGIRRSLQAGTGAVGDVLSFFPARQAFANSPLKGRIYLETLGRDPAFNRQLLRSIGTILDESCAGALELGISPHSPYTLSGEYLEEVLGFARRRRAPSCMHFAESPDEVDFLCDSRGPLAETLYPFVGWQNMVPPPARRTPTTYLAERGGLVPSNLLVHGVQVSDEDAELLARSGATVVLCPRSNARLGVGRAPVELYRRAGVPLALGTDSLASCDSLSVWDELAFAHTWFEGRLAPRALLEMATLHGARALGLEGEMGALAAGQGGHFQVLSPAALPRLEELEEFLCAPGRTAEVAALYIDSRDVLQID